MNNFAGEVQDSIILQKNGKKGFALSVILFILLGLFGGFLILNGKAFASMTGVKMESGSASSHGRSYGYIYIY